MIQRIVAKLRGKRGHAGVDAVIGRFQRDVTALDAAHEEMGHEVRSNAVQQAKLVDRNILLRDQRERAQRVRSKIIEIVG